MRRIAASIAGGLEKSFKRTAVEQRKTFAV
jgi:hypothetical protein